MKLRKTLIFTFIAVALLSFFSGCKETNNPDLDTTLRLNDDYSGERTIICNFPSSIFPVNSGKEISLDAIIKDNCPQDLKYEKLSNETCISYSFSVVFRSKEDYVSKVSSILKRDVGIVMDSSDTIFTSGKIVSEDFDSSDILSFIPEGILKSSDFKNKKIDLICRSNKLLIGNNQYDCDKKISFNNMEYKPVNELKIETSKNKDDSYSRNLILNIPNKACDELGSSKILEYMNSRIDKNLKYDLNYVTEENSTNFKITYSKISLEELNNVTNMFMNSNENIKYHDDNDHTSIMCKQRVFEECLNTYSYLSDDKKFVPVTYTYKSSNNLSYGAFYNNTSWEESKNLSEDKAFSITSNNSPFKVRLFEQESFVPNSININLIVEGNGSFSRKVDLKYSKDNIKSFNYATNYLINIQGLTIYSKQESESVTCCTSISGTCDKLNETIKKMFGSDNYVCYSFEDNKYKAYNQTTLTDNISFKYSLPKNISYVPLVYVVHENNKVDVAKLKYQTFDNAETIDLSSYTSGKNDDIPISLNVSDVNIEYTANTLNMVGVAFIISITILYFFVVFSIMAFINRRVKIKLKEKN